VADTEAAAAEARTAQAQELFSAVLKETAPLLAQNRFADAVALLDKKAKDLALSDAAELFKKEKADIEAVAEMRRLAVEALRKMVGQTVELQMGNRTVQGKVVDNPKLDGVTLNVGGPEITLSAAQLHVADVARCFGLPAEMTEEMRRKGLLYLAAGDIAEAKRCFTKAREGGLGDVVAPYLERIRALELGETEAAALKAWEKAETLFARKQMPQAKDAYAAFEREHGQTACAGRLATTLRERYASIETAMGLRKELTLELGGGAKTGTGAVPQDPDFLVQGEYLGVPGTNAAQKIGCQVVALGGGRFDAVLYLGGFPGEGWDPNQKKTTSHGQTEPGGEVVFADGPWRARIKGGVMAVTTPEGQELGILQRVERKSPTLGLRPPPGAVVLFDGTSAANFEKGEMTAEGTLKAGGKSKRTFQDFSLHLEFRIPFMPTARGQGRANSGVYLQYRYEVQILDSFGLEGTADECGAIYRLAAPAVNMCYPPLTWQTYDVDYTAARYGPAGKKIRNAVVTVRHNGAVIHQDVEITKGTGANKPEGATPGPICLQGHAADVQFRNIWALERR
jgi:tetratricopeptide (TPR) repeat protein